MAEFNFDAFNQLKRTAPAGLKIYLAKQLLDEVHFQTVRFNNPLKHALSDICESLGDFRETWKKAAADRARNDSSNATAHIDNLEAMKVAPTSADGGKIDSTQDALANTAAILLQRLEALEREREEDKEQAMELVSNALANMELMTGNSAAKQPSA